MTTFRTDLVSIVMITYNRADFITDAIRSVQSQSYEAWELIIVDDGSTDETEKVVEQLNIRNCFYFKVRHCGNLSILRNYGVGKSNGEYIAYLDSDDVWHSDKLNQQISIIKNHPVGLVATNHVTFTSDYELTHKTDGTVAFRSLHFRELLLNSISVYPSTILYNRSRLTTACPHDESLPWNDLGFITVFAARYGAIWLSEKFVAIRKHPSNISTQRRTEAVGFRDMIGTTSILHAEGFIDKSEKRDFQYRFYDRMGTMLRQENQFADAQSSYGNALKLKPFAFKTLVKLFLTIVKM
jgi:glycosyltransferase involved in cell wall biosynthesis